MISWMGFPFTTVGFAVDEVLKDRSPTPSSKMLSVLLPEPVAVNCTTPGATRVGPTSAGRLRSSSASTPGANVLFLAPQRGLGPCIGSPLCARTDPPPPPRGGAGKNRLYARECPGDVHRLRARRLLQSKYISRRIGR